MKIITGLIEAIRQTRRSKENVVLQLLADRGPMYGLDMLRRSDGSLNRITLYSRLGVMEDRGLIHGEEVMECDAGQLPRRIYHITDLGRRQLADS
jgi:DNA-binding PadR family transcriptional regulator